MNFAPLKDENTSLKLTWLLICASYFFSIGFRLFLSNYTSIEGLKKSGEFINTADGYFFAKGALDLIQSETGPTYFAKTSALAQLTAFLVKIFSINFEIFIFLMPAFVGSLIVIPLVLIGNQIHQTTAGFIAALTASTAPSYYVRSQAGYFDTDMLNIVLPMFTIYFVMNAIISKQKIYLALITVTVTLYQWWYPQAYSLHTALMLSMIIYGFIFDRRNIFNYQIAFFILLGITGLTPATKIILAVLLYILPRYQTVQVAAKKFFWYIFAFAFAYFIAVEGFQPILTQLKHYFMRTDEVTNSSLHFYNVMSTVGEATNISFSYFAEQTSGHMILFIIACLGYVLLLLAYRPLLLTLPMAGLGFLALFGGFRFAFYANPAIALGLAYFFFLVTKKIQSIQLRCSIIFAATAFALYMNYITILPARSTKVFNDNEIAALNYLSLFTKPNDYLISWWDYGYALRYYTNTQTLIDGGNHNGSMNYPVALALTETNFTAAAHILRIATEHDHRIQTHGNNMPGYIESYMARNQIQDPNQFFEAITDENYPLPRKSHDIYLVLPYRMLKFLGIIQLFSNIDLTTGQQKHPYFFFSTRDFKENQDSIYLNDKLTIDKNNWTALLEKKEIKLANLIVTEHQNNHLAVKKSHLHNDGNLDLIIMKDYNTAILADNKIANSVFIKLFVLEENDSNYFEPILVTPFMKVYKLKI